MDLGEPDGIPAPANERQAIGVEHGLDLPALVVGIVPQGDLVMLGQGLTKLGHQVADALGV